MNFLETGKVWFFHVYGSGALNSVPLAVAVKKAVHMVSTLFFLHPKVFHITQLEACMCLFGALFAFKFESQVL